MIKAINILNKFYLFYLGILPSIATFFIVQKIGNFSTIGMLIFLLGIVAVSVYLAMIASYQRATKNLISIVLLIFSGPIFAILAGLNYLETSDFFLSLFFIENIAIWLSIFILVFFKNPERWQLIGSIFLSILLIGGLTVLYYSFGFFNKSLLANGFLILGVIEVFWVKFKTLDDDYVTGDDGSPYIIINLFLWIFTYIITAGLIDKK